MSCGVGHRRGTDPALLWLWRRLAAATPIRSLVQELPYATPAALKSRGKKKKKRNYWSPYGLVKLSHGTTWIRIFLMGRSLTIISISFMFGIFYFPVFHFI